MKYRKKPVVIEAFQMTEERRRNNSEWPKWLNEAWNKDHPSEGAVWPEKHPNSDGKDRLCIGTLEGVYIVSWDDYIIQGIKGEIYACKPDIFEATYERVDSIAGLNIIKSLTEVTEQTNIQPDMQTLLEIFDREIEGLKIFRCIEVELKRLLGGGEKRRKYF